MDQPSSAPGHIADHLIGPAVRGAIEALRWTAQQDVLVQGATAHTPAEYDSESTDLRYSDEDLPAEVEAEIRQDVEAFVLGDPEDCLAYVEARSPQAVAEYDGQTSAEWAAECIGHDFILTRNHEGAGFWDRGLGDLGDRLTTAAQAFGSQTLVRGITGGLSLIS